MRLLEKINRRGRMKLSELYVPKGRQDIRLLSAPGFRMLAPINDDVGRTIWMTGSFERAETEFFASVVRPDDVCFDVGGNVGYMAMLLASKATSGSIHVFEPIPVNAALVNLNAQLNDFVNVCVENVAVAATSGRTTFTVSNDSAYSSLKDTGRSAASRDIDVTVTTLDEYFDGSSLDRVDIVKVDVEGAEQLVIDGAQRLLSDTSRRPRLIMLELYDLNLNTFGANVLTVVEQMSVLGYQPRYLAHGKLMPFTSEMANRETNVFFEVAGGDRFDCKPCP